MIDVISDMTTYCILTHNWLFKPHVLIHVWTNWNSGQGQAVSDPGCHTVCVAWKWGVQCSQNVSTNTTEMVHCKQQAIKMLILVLHLLNVIPQNTNLTLNEKMASQSLSCRYGLYGLLYTSEILISLHNEKFFTV